MECLNKAVHSWVSDVAQQLKPDSIHWVTGAPAEQEGFCEQLVQEGSFRRLNPQHYPNSFWYTSDPSDVARVEDRTFICSRSKDDAGPTNIWCEPQKMYGILKELMQGCMRGKTMYVIPYLMGPVGSPFSKVGFELTDSLYVVVNMAIMARVGDLALQELSHSRTDFVRGIHSVGTLDPNERYICHFPEDGVIVSFNTGYGGNALQGKKCFALRTASVIGRNEGWLAEHMLIVGITPPQGEKIYVAAAFPSACGKTNLAMLIPPELYQREGWKIETVGDDIAWLNFGDDGRLYAINPEAGFFGVAPGTSEKTNQNAMRTISRNTIFTNTALDLDSLTPWWEGIGKEPSANMLDWKKNEWKAGSVSAAAHANSRFTTPAQQCPSIDPAWQSPLGVPISAIVFGGRRAKAAPLVYEATSWQHGVFVGLTMASETTAAAAGALGQLRRDPMAMRPFIGYHIGDYIAHWLKMAQHQHKQMPKVFHVNWFRTGSDGKFLWPGFGDNVRVLEWVVKRVRGEVSAQESALGMQPNPEDIRLEGLSISKEQIEELLRVEASDWSDDIASQRAFFDDIGPKLPRAMNDEHLALKKRLGL